jgi:hypothetical protein
MGDRARAAVLQASKTRCITASGGALSVCQQNSGLYCHRQPQPRGRSRRRGH